MQRFKICRSLIEARQAAFTGKGNVQQPARRWVSDDSTKEGDNLQSTTSTSEASPIEQNQAFIQGQVDLRSGVGEEKSSAESAHSGKAGGVSRDMTSQAEGSDSWLKSLLKRDDSAPPQPPRPYEPHQSKQSGRKIVDINAYLDPAASWAAPLRSSSHYSKDKVRKIRSSGYSAAERQTFDQAIMDIMNSSGMGTGLSGIGNNTPFRGLDMGTLFPTSLETRDFGGRISTNPRAKRFIEKEESEEDDALIEELDRLKEDMETIRTDAELVSWAIPNVLTPTMIDGIPIFQPVYPRILGHLLKVIRTNYQNPHLTLAIFHYAQTSSLESYISGCLAPAYNELLVTRWECFRDLAGVEAGVNEMEMGGVGWDRRTHRLVDGVVEDVSKDVLEFGEGHWGKDVAERLRRLEKRVARDLKEQQAVYSYQQREKQARRKQVALEDRMARRYGSASY